MSAIEDQIPPVVLAHARALAAALQAYKGEMTDAQRAEILDIAFLDDWCRCGNVAGCMCDPSYDE